jgi:Tol biopolymer transport system component
MFAFQDLVARLIAGIIALCVGALLIAMVAARIVRGGADEIVFVRGIFNSGIGIAGVHALDVDRALTAPLSDPQTEFWFWGFDWSPDRNQIAYSAVGNERADLNAIYVTSLNTSDPRFVIGGAATSSHPTPVWSPDGSRIAYKMVTGTARTGRLRDLWVVDAAGGEPRQLTSRGVFGMTNFSDMTWSPDGRYLAYSSSAFISNELGSENAIYIVDVETGVEQFVTHVDSEGDLYFRLLTPVWSPDGMRLAFVSEHEGNANLYVVPVTGGEPVRLTFGGAQSGLPAWSPDSQWIAYIALESRRSPSLRLVRADGGETRILTSDAPITAAAPVWSPDGTWLAFTAGRSGVTDIHIIRADGAGLRQLTDSRAEGLPAVESGIEHLSWRR